RHPLAPAATGRGLFRHRVGPIVDRHQLVERDVRVALGRRKTRVAEELLDGAKIGASLEQMRGAGMAKRVRVEIAAPGAERPVALNQRLHAANAEPGSVTPQEERARVLPTRAGMAKLGATFEVR